MRPFWCPHVTKCSYIYAQSHQPVFLQFSAGNQLGQVSWSQLNTTQIPMDIRQMFFVFHLPAFPAILNDYTYAFILLSTRIATLENTLSKPIYMHPMPPGLCFYPLMLDILLGLSQKRWELMENMSIDCQQLLVMSCKYKLNFKCACLRLICDLILETYHLHTSEIIRISKFAEL